MKELIFITPDDERWYVLDDLPYEEWRDIKNYEGLYKISNYGRVKTLLSRVMILKNSINRFGYYDCTLHKDGKSRKKRIHVLVANAFIPNIHNKSDINHKTYMINGNIDNRVINLEWVDRYNRYSFIESHNRN